MSDKASACWVIEVLGEGAGGKTQRYAVGAADREQAIAAVVQLLGPSAQIISSAQFTPDPVEVVSGEIIPL
jgi:hypothetical protein